MKLLCTYENRSLVHNIQNLVENSGIEVMLKNEFAGGASGALVPHETWLELWVINDDDYARAMKVISSSFSCDKDLEWICTHCLEQNDASFDFCWNCHHEAPSSL